MRAGLAFTQLVEFSDGFPDGDIAWSLLDDSGTEVTSGDVTPAADSVSAIITVTGAQNTLGAGVLSGSRELNWAYTVGGIVHNGSTRYRLDAFLPLGVSPAGVRNKLGLEPSELEDDAIDLAAAYGKFQQTVTAAALATVVADGGYNATLARNGIEALAAITLIPSLQVKLASKQSSGTDQFQRAKIDWDAIVVSLNQYLADAYSAIAPNLDEFSELPPIFVAVVRPDVVTGEDV